jgi:hypothetical protein
MNDVPSTRRKFLKYFGLSTAGVAFAAAVDSSRERIRAGIEAGEEDAKVELEKLKQSYEELDSRTKFILRVVLIFTGLDIFT